MKVPDSLIPVFSQGLCFAPETDRGLVYKNASLHRKIKTAADLTLEQLSLELFTATLRGARHAL